MNRWSKMMPALLATSIVWAMPSLARAAWSTDPLVNLPICTQTDYQDNAAIVSDGAHGAIIAWSDRRDGWGYDIYAQRVSANGIPLWGASGRPILIATGDQFPLGMVADGAGGAIVVWREVREPSTTTDLYAQRITGTGTLAWGDGGAAICTYDNSQNNPAIVSDGAGGAIVTWQDWGRTLYHSDIYAQRISHGGAVQWSADGVAVCSAEGDQERPSIVADGSGGAIIAWSDPRTPVNYQDIYMQRIAANGTAVWTTDGVAVCTAENSQINPTLMSDGAGGAFVAWEDIRTGTTTKVYMRPVSAAGAPQWAADGVTVSTGVGYEWTPRMVPDGAGGAIVTWMDYRFANWDTYAQRITGAGTKLWSAPGVVLCGNIYGHQQYETILPDGAGGAIITWQDGRDLDYTGDHVYAQRVNASGAIQWTSAGKAVSTAPGGAAYPVTCADGVGGMIVAWYDKRNSYYPDIYAQHVNGNGSLGDGTVDVVSPASSSISLAPAGSNPVRGGALAMRFSLVSSSPASLELFDLAGRRIAGREVGGLGAGTHTVDLGKGLEPGLYLVRLTQEASQRIARVTVLE